MVIFLIAISHYQRLLLAYSTIFSLLNHVKSQFLFSSIQHLEWNPIMLNHSDFLQFHPAFFVVNPHLMCSSQQFFHKALVGEVEDLVLVTGKRSGCGSVLGEICLWLMVDGEATKLVVYLDIMGYSDLYKHNWRCPKIGLPLVFIHFGLGFSTINHPFEGTFMTMETRIWRFPQLK